VSSKDAAVVGEGQIDPTQTRTARLASEKIGENLWNQIYLVSFELRTGGTVEAIARVSASTDANMRSGPAVYVVSKVLNPEGKTEPPR
jgi:hypothetical protein